LRDLEADEHLGSKIGPIVHMRWDPSRVVRWVDAVRKGKPDCKSINFPSEFISGGSIGPVWKGWDGGGSRSFHEGHFHAGGVQGLAASWIHTTIAPLLLFCQA
jgi:hypothetical protein